MDHNFERLCFFPCDFIEMRHFLDEILNELSYCLQNNWILSIVEAMFLVNTVAFSLHSNPFHEKSCVYSTVTMLSWPTMAIKLMFARQILSGN